MEGVATKAPLDALWLALPSQDVNAITGDEEGVSGSLELDLSDKMGESSIVKDEEL